MSSKYIGRIPASIKPTISHLILTGIVFLKFDSTREGRHWGPIRESKRRGFSGYRYIVTYQGSFECQKENFPYLIEFKKQPKTVQSKRSL